MASTNTIGMQSLNTNDNTIFQINPSQPVFHNDTVDEESVLRDFINNQNI
jgi:dynactin complex subunit